MDIENLKKLIEDLNKTRVERQGFILLPTIDGYEFFPFKEETLRAIVRLLTAQSKFETMKEEHKW